MSGRGYQRPMPEGFAADAYALNTLELKDKYRAGDLCVRRWRLEVGPPPEKAVRPPPEDFAERAANMSQRALRSHYGIGSAMLTSWFKQSGLSPLDSLSYRPWNVRPVPDDFHQIAPTMTKTQLRAHYTASDITVNRWLAETAIRPQYFAPTPPHGFRLQRMGNATVTVLRNYSAHDEAADVLRHYFAVYRCDERGRANVKGKLWRVGNVVVDDDELLARADRKRPKCA